VFTVVRFRRVITLKNIAAAFPGESASVHLSMARSSFESVAVTLCEFMLFPTFDEQTMRRLVRVENEGLLRDEYARGKGVILLTAHYGSWECFAQAAGMVLGGHGRLLAKTQSNPLVHHAVDAWRKRFGFRTTASNLGVREVLAVLREGGWVVIAADQSAPRESPRIPFFGRPIPTYQGPAVVSLKTGAPLLLGLARRLEDDSYVIEFEKVPSDGLRADDENDVRELTRRHVAATERRIRMDPTQWMWMHRRWKHAGPDPGEDRA
jgi:KDO2-lipid IV(A) lauroyltransferase